ncbi:MAG: 2-C-methyl-D-erythritol 2,4-cyclodiphosphate synthase [Acidimicrobiales bacterium]
MSVWAVIVAAGEGDRFGGRKQYEALGGLRVLDWSLGAARATCDGVVVVVPAGRAGDHEPAADLVVAGGPTRSASVRAGLAGVPADVDVVVVHDAARPAASRTLWQTAIAAVESGADAAVPAVAVRDTIREIDGGSVDRARLVAVQTPQAFRAAVLRCAHAGEPDATDDAALVDAIGGRVVVVDGEPENTKVTTPADLHRLAGLVERRTTRVGLGFDVHPFAAPSDDRALVLGGVRFADERGLAGHSDGDVVAHACIDALLGAAGLGDIGQHFPDTEASGAGADSLGLLADAARLVRDGGWEPANIDCSVVLDSPRLMPHRADMEARLSHALGAPVTVKGKRPEGLGAVGHGEGIVAMAVALLERMGER